MQHNPHDWPTLDQLSTRNMVPLDQLDESETEFATHEEAMAGLVSGKLTLSDDTRKTMGLD